MADSRKYIDNSAAIWINVHSLGTISMGLSHRIRRIVEISKRMPDFQSRVNYFRLRYQISRKAGTSADRALLPMQVRELDGHTIVCRCHSTDILVFDDTFKSLYHLPPEGLQIHRILDLGSNIGLTLAHYATIFPTAQLCGVELDAGNLEICRMNCASFSDRCKLLHAAVWNECGSVSYGGETEWGFSITPDRSKSQSGAKSVDAITISKILDANGWDEVDFVKMDIEGAEEKVFSDGSSWEKRVKCIKVEIHPPYTVQACIKDLENMGFLCHQDSSHWACVIAMRA